MSSALTPRLTSLDQCVLAAIPEHGAVRTRTITEQLNGSASSQEILGILRGFEHFGQVSCRNGWWRRTSTA